jgi:hypothetical protein
MSAILRAFAELAPAGKRVPLDVTAGGQPLAWSGLRTLLTAAPAARLGPGSPDAGTAAPLRVSRTRASERLAAIDALHEHERLLREGWVYLVGTAVIDGDRRRICHPLLSRPVLLQRALGAFTLLPVGDLEISPLIGDAETAGRLEDEAQFGGGALEATSSPEPEVLPRLTRLAAWVRRVAEAADLPVDEVVDWTRPPERWRDADRVVAVVGAGLHLSRDVGRPGQADVLRSWAQVVGIDGTAFARLYAQLDQDGVTAAPAASDDEIRSPLPLSPAQRDVLRRVRSEPLVAISGAPGNGKSHLVAAMAVDAVARGDSVLIATPSRYAADVIGELLYRQPGPEPVLFGSSASRRGIAADLADGAGVFARAAADAAAAADADSRHRVAEVEQVIGRLLATEAAAQELPRWEPLLPHLTRAAPGAFAPAADLERIGALLETAERAGGGWIAALRRRSAARRLRSATGVPVDPPLLRRALDAALSRRAAAELATLGGTRIGALWNELFAADAAAAEAFGRHVQAQARRARIAGRDRTAAVTALAKALRSGRAARRDQLRRLDAAALTEALPLWIGALTDIDDLLPERPNRFDLIILDEASQIDQLRAAPALLRARRAVVVGDPRQLRHVSFVADVDQRRALQGLGPALAAQLDVRGGPGQLPGGAPPQCPASDRLLGPPVLRRAAQDPHAASGHGIRRRHPGRARRRRDRGQRGQRGRGRDGRRAGGLSRARGRDLHRGHQPLPGAGGRAGGDAAGAVRRRRDRPARPARGNRPRLPGRRTRRGGAVARPHRRRRRPAPPFRGGPAPVQRDGDPRPPSPGGRHLARRRR